MTSEPLNGPHTAEQSHPGPLRPAEPSPAAGDHLSPTDRAGFGLDVAIADFLFKSSVWPRDKPPQLALKLALDLIDGVINTRIQRVAGEGPPLPTLDSLRTAIADDIRGYWAGRPATHIESIASFLADQAMHHMITAFEQLQGRRGDAYALVDVERLARESYVRNAHIQRLYQALRISAFTQPDAAVDYARDVKNASDPWGAPVTTYSEIWKYPLDITDRQVVEIFAPAVILDAQFQDDRLCLWAGINPNTAHLNCEILIVGTGNPVPEGVLTHITTVQHPGRPYVWHLFQRHQGPF